MHHTRTYNPSVLVGNWKEDNVLEEDTMKDFLARRDKGELLIQQSAELMGTCLLPKEISISRDGYVHFGDTFVLVNPDCDGRPASALNISYNLLGVMSVTASTSTAPVVRNTFVIGSCDGSHGGQTLNYGQSFFIIYKDKNLFLHSDRATLAKCCKRSHHNEVTLVPIPSHLTEWKILPFNPLTRMENEFTPVHANHRMILSHVKTNLNLNNEVEHQVKTRFGLEFEMSTYTAVDSHKAETETNHWVISMLMPGDGSMPGAL